MRGFVLGLSAAWAAVSAPALAEEAMVSAADPEGLSNALELAGYDPELTTDDIGDPLIRVDFGGRSGGIFFYGCSEQTNDGCDSLQFQSGFDRKEPWTAAEAIEISQRFRFAAVSLDDEGDPFISWDVVTGDGLPTRVFLRSVLMFSDALNDMEEVIFADE